MTSQQIKQSFVKIINDCLPDIFVNIEQSDGKDMSVLIDAYKTTADGKDIAYINNQGFDITDYLGGGSPSLFLRNYQLTLMSQREDLCDLVDKILEYFIVNNTRIDENVLIKLIGNINTRLDNILYSTLTFQLICTI